MTDRQWGFRTRALHAGGQPDPTTGARAVPIYQSTSFVFDDVADAADLFALQKYGTIYSRISNPTTAAFEERMASLEGGIGAVATASGQAAEFLTALALAEQGTNLVSSSALYGGTHTMFETTLGRFGIEARFVDGDDPGCLRRLDRRPTPVSCTRRSSATRRGRWPTWRRWPTWPTPTTCRWWWTPPSPRRTSAVPLEHGADIVVHSATKFIGGHGTSIGGVMSWSPGGSTGGAVASRR